jgi:hypothetical protein
MSDLPSLHLPPPFTTPTMNTADMPDVSAPMTTRATYSSTGDMKHHLQNLLDSKEKQLQQAATLGQRVLAQRVELEERIRQLQEMDADKVDEEEIDSEARERYRELAETIEEWDSENSMLSSAFGVGKVRFWMLFFPCVGGRFLVLGPFFRWAGSSAGWAVCTSSPLSTQATSAYDVFQFTGPRSLFQTPD